jgi:hypothetical protein
MAVAAIDAVVADMVLVAELDGLLADNVLVRQIRRTREPHHSGYTQPRQENAGKDTNSRDKICAAVKNLRHVNCALSVVSSAEKGSRNQASTSIPTGITEPESESTR